MNRLDPQVLIARLRRITGTLGISEAEFQVQYLDGESPDDGVLVTFPEGAAQGQLRPLISAFASAVSRAHLIEVLRARELLV